MRLKKTTLHFEMLSGRCAFGTPGIKFCQILPEVFFQLLFLFAIAHKSKVVGVRRKQGCVFKCVEQVVNMDYKE